MPEASRLCNELIAAGLDRRSFIVALGGGVTGDLVGFVAAILFRGLPYAQVPTTLLAMVDSSVGGKTGVNSPAGKNLIGSFHQPATVIADTATLETLPERELYEGLAEVIKHGVIRDASLVEEANMLLGNDREKLVARNVAIKARVVEEDETEVAGTRALLNFGHTVGHAIEQVAGYGKFLHGEAISLGMMVALETSCRRAGLPPEAKATVAAALHQASLPTIIPDSLDTEQLLQALQRDKKFLDGNIRFVVTPGLGSALLSDQITEKDIREAINASRTS